MTIEEIKTLPKMELHCHLSGAIPLATINKIITANNIRIPPHFNYPDDLFVKRRVKNMFEYFRPWMLLKKLSVNKEALFLMFEGALTLLKEDNIDYCELRFSPFTLIQNTGVDPETALSYLVETITRAEEAVGITARLILTLERYNYDLRFAEQLLTALRSLQGKTRIVAVDVTGDEQFLLPPEASIFFRTCKDELGLGITIHAGETGNHNNIKQAIVDFKADRIGHATALFKDETIVDLVVQNEICIELCLQSNYLASNVDSLEVHPIHQFIKYKIPFVLCSDNPANHNFSLSQEYELFLRLTKRGDILRDMYSRQRYYAFHKRLSINSTIALLGS